MLDLRRLKAIRILGPQMEHGQPKFTLAEDAPYPLGTGTSFAIHHGETISEAVERVDQRYAATPHCAEANRAEG